MANQYFTFKQFTILQDKSAMKVCTDSCLFGASLPIQHFAFKPITKVLDIGTGTGLLSLMFSQLQPLASITAIEIDEDAFKQASENVANSNFASKIVVLKDDFNEFVSTQKFDLIICNPPFYKNDLKSNATSKNIAHHSTALTLDHLLAKAKLSLEDDGMLCLLLPFKRKEDLEALLKQEGLFIAKQIVVHQTEKHAPFRIIVYLQKTPSSTIVQKIIIKENGVYSTDFVRYLKDFYLNL